MNLSLPNAEKRPVMTLLSGPLDVFSHCCRIVLSEKDIDCNVENVNSADLSKIGEYNPYGETPTLLDRDVVLYGISVILEYLDERFPHPPLMPVDPVNRAKTRLIVSRLTRDWLLPVNHQGEGVTLNFPSKLKKSIHDGLTALSLIFVDQTYFLGEDFTLVDAYFGPLLWRLNSYGIQLPKQAEPLIQYGERLFARPSFHHSMSKQELELRC